MPHTYVASYHHCIFSTKDRQKLLAKELRPDVSRAMQLIKGGSSHWLRNEKIKKFGWQEGFAAFSVSTSQLSKTIEYIDGQEEHHKKVDFKTEYLEFLKKNNVEYDPRYVFD